MMSNEIVRLSIGLALLLSCTFLVACQDTHKVGRLSFSLTEDSPPKSAPSLNMRTDSAAESKLSGQGINFLAENDQSIV
ncbi:MAG: hypothetical protein ACRCZB_02560, partial [Bacteroidales bacterium]